MGFEKYVEQLKDFMQHYNADKEDQVTTKMQAKKRPLEGGAGDIRDDDYEAMEDESQDVGAGDGQKSKRLRKEGLEDDGDVIDIVKK